MKCPKNPIFLHCLLAVGLCFFQQSAQSQLQAKFSANPIKGCTPLVVQFSDESSGKPSSWRWELGNGTISLFQHPSTVYYLPGKYPVKLIVKNATGSDSIVRQQYIIVYANPVANFLASDSTGCFPLKVQFSDKSIAPGTTINKWEWDFGDGHTSTVQNPQHTYLNAGNHTVTLKVTTDKGCTHTFSKKQYIQIPLGVKTAFSDSSDMNCKAPVTMHFMNASTGPGTLSYSWDFGDGKYSNAQNPVHTYTADGTYTVTLVTASDAGCADTLRKTGYGSASTQFNMPDSICVGQTISIANTSSPVPVWSRWDFGDGSSSMLLHPEKVYSSTGIFSIKLVNKYGKCIDSIVKPINAFSKTTATFSADKEYLCSTPAAVQFTGSMNGIAYRWDFGDGSTATTRDPIHTYTSTGNYTVKFFVTGPGGCVDSIIKKDFIVVARPQLQVTGLPARGCLPLTVALEGRLVSPGSVTSWHWDFGDGTSSSLAAPVKTYTTEGTYTVKLVFVTAAGCKDSVVVPEAVRASRKPLADFSATPMEACVSSSVQFTNLSTPKGTKWLWAFGDGGFSKLENPLYKFNDTGYLDVKLIVWNNECSDTIVKKDIVYIDLPLASFMPYMNCNDKYLRQFGNSSLGAKSWYWDFGDGVTSTDWNPSHRYNAKGNYKVTLTVLNDTCKDICTQNVIIADEHLDFNTDVVEVCKGGEVVFTPLHYNAEYISWIRWQFGDGEDSIHVGKLTYNYKNPGAYQVVMRYTDVNGCSDKVMKQQFIRTDGPTASFTVQQQTICASATAKFEDKSVAGGTATIMQWNWNYGDGTSSSNTTSPFIHKYTDAGKYTVTLIVQDNYGCLDTVTKPAAIIISKPVAAFSSVDSNSCTGKPVRFTNSSAGSNLQYYWNFGDGKTSTQVSPAHTYSATGFYTVTLHVTDAYGCTDSVKNSNYVSITIPVAGFTMSDSISSCPPLQVQFTSQARNYVALKWEFGDGSVSILENPEHFYNMPGVYYVKQIILGPGGCTDTARKKIIVKGPQGVFSYAPLAGCKPLTVPMKASSADKVSFVWDFNDGSVLQTKDSNITHTYTDAGSFLPNLILIDSTGCRVPITGKDTLKVVGVTVRAAMEEYRLCTEGFIQFTDRSVANDYITGHRWDFGDGSTSTETNPRHFYKKEGTYTIKHVAITSLGCKDTVMLADTVKVWPKPEITILGDNSACEPATMRFSTRVFSGDSTQFKWQWDFGNGRMAYTAQVDSQAYQHAGNYNVQLQVSYMDFCRDTATHSINIRPLPTTFAGNDTFVCRDNPVQLRATGADRYLWTSAPGISCSDCATTMINPQDNISYIVTGFTDYGCSKKDTINIRVRQRFDMQVKAGDTLCQGQTLPLLASGAELYEWYPADGLNNAYIANPKATPSKTILYTVYGRDSDRCFVDSAKVPVTVYPIPRIFAGNDTTVLTGTNLPLRIIGSPDITKWKWSPANGLSCIDCHAPNAAIKSTITYRVDVVNEGGCRSSDDVTIHAVCNGGNYFIPNTFSPTGDGANDVFYVRGKGVHRIHSLKIFNRWGQLVFEKRDFMPNDASAGWDGTYNGKRADMDVYVYIAEVICDNSAIVPLKGDITLIR